jgi:hypothetical protein
MAKNPSVIFINVRVRSENIFPMATYTLTADERELLISLTDAETELCITFSSPVWTRRLEKLAHDLDKEVTWLNPYTVRVSLPQKCLSLKRPRVTSDKQREALAQARATLRAHADEREHSPSPIAFLPRKPL